MGGLGTALLGPFCSQLEKWGDPGHHALIETQANWNTSTGMGGWDSLISALGESSIEQGLFRQLRGA